VGLFQTNDLAIGDRVEQHRIQAIGRAVRSVVAQVSSGKAILIRNLVITADCEEILGNDPLAGEAGCRRITVCISIAETGQKGRYAAALSSTQIDDFPEDRFVELDGTCPQTLDSEHRSRQQPAPHSFQMQLVRICSSWRVAARVVENPQPCVI